MQLGRSLCFGADGSTAAIGGAAGVHIVDIAGVRPPVLHELSEVIDIAAVADELWVAAGRSPRLYRFGRDHALVAEQPLWGGSGVLRPTAAGEPGALWSESPPAVVLVSDKTSVVGLPIAPDCVVPVSPTRWVVCRRDRVQLRDLGTERWSVAIPTGAGGRVVDGAVLFDGRTVALVIETANAFSQLIVVSLHDGTIQHRITLSGIGIVRFAAARGFALMRSEVDTLVLFDLRFGQILKEHREPQPVVDAAIDPAGRAFMVRFGEDHDDISIGSISDMLAKPGSPRPAADHPPVVVPPPPLATLEVAAATPTAAYYQGHRGLGTVQLLGPRTTYVRASPAAGLALLEQYREVIAAMTGAAIARAWDQGTLSAPVDHGLPFHAEVAGLRGRASGRAAEDVDVANREVDAAITAETLFMSKLDEALPPLAVLAAEFNLTAAAQLLLLAVAAPSLWGELARLYGILANDTGRGVIDELLASEILRGHVDRPTLARELDRDAPLIRYGLIQVGAGWMRPFLPLACDLIVLRMLRGNAYEVELDNIKVAKSSRSFDDLLIPANVKDDLARRIAGAPETPNARIVVRGRNGVGRHAILAAISDAAGRQLAVIDASTIVRDLKHRRSELATALQRAHLVGMLPCVDGLETLPSDDPSAKDQIRQILDDHHGPLAIRLPWDAEPPLSPGYLGIDLPPLTMEQRVTTWRVLLAEHGLFVRDPDELADRFRVGPGVIVKACEQVALRHPKTASTAEPVDASLALETAIRQHLERALRATATRVEKLATWARVILPPDIQESVLELIARIKRRRQVYDTWGMGDVLTTARGVTALFQGGPGTGKTLVASAIANELGMDLYRVDLSRIMSKWIGETEQNLAKLFDAAEDGHAIVLFDEADSLFAKRTEVKSSVDRYANLEVNYLLQRLDTFEGIAILTTNFGTSIDNAFKRRLSFRLTFPFPDEEAREQLWKSHLPSLLPRSGSFDLADLARRYQLSGGYIRNIAVRAAFLAAEEHSPLTQEHLERAIKAEFREIGKIAESGVLE